jgi:sugar phosphate isomerase/epimerase
MKFSVFTASTPDWEPAEAARILAGQGWDGIEWRVIDQRDAPRPGFWAGNRATWPLTGLEDRLADIERVTRDAGLEFSGIGGYVRCDAHENVERMLTATATLGARQVRVTMPALGTDDDYRSLFRRTRDDLEWVVARARVHGVKALVELHHRTITASTSSAIRLIDGLDPDHVGVIHDIGNLIVEGHEDFDAAFEMLGPYLAHVHVKNARWRPTDRSGEDGARIWDTEWVPLPEGQGNIQAYLDALVRHGYDQWIAVEDFSTQRPLADRTRHNLDYLRRAYERSLESV